MTAIQVVSDDEYELGVTLDIEPLLRPYLQQGPLSVRIEKLPPRSRLSKGRNNGDATFSLKPDELDDLVFVPAEGANGSAVTLAVRIVKVDDDYATTLALLDLPVLLGEESAESTNSGNGGVGGPGNTKREASRKPAKLTGGALKKNSQALAGMPAEEKVETLKLQRAFDVLSKSLAETEARAEHAERKAEDAEARIAELEAGAGEAGIDVESIRAEVSEKYEQELTKLRQQLETAAADFSQAHKKALKTAAASHASELEQKVAAAQQQLTQEFEGRLAQALREAEAKAAAQAEKQRQDQAAEAHTALSKARENWKNEETQRLAATKTAFEAELSDLRERFTAAAGDIETARKQATEIADANRAREIADLQSAHARALEENTAATKAELERSFEGRLAEARREAEQGANQHLSEAREKSQVDAETGLARAKDAWREEEEKRLADVEAAHEAALSKLRQELKTASEEIARVREQVSSDTDTWHARELEELQRTHAGDLEEKVAAAKNELEEQFAERLATALREASEAAEARLTEERRKLEKDADAAVSAARATWSEQESTRHAGEKDERETELSGLRAQLETATSEIEALRKQASAAVQPAPQDIGEDRAAATVEHSDEDFEARLAGEREVWKAEAGAEMAKARANWKKAEERRLSEALRGRRVDGNAGQGRKISTSWAYQDWIPRRSRIVAVAIVGLIALAVLHPDTKSLVLEYSMPAVAEIKSRVEPLLNPQPAVVEAPLPQAPAPVEQRAVIGVESANVRSGPSTGTNVVGSVTRGSTVTLLGAQDNWLQVRFGAGAGQVGWIYRDLLNGNAR